MSDNRPRPVIVDLFAGIGGLGLGAAMAGGDLRLSVELDPTASATLVANPAFVTGDVLCANVQELSGAFLRERAGISSEDLVIVGGPPCQPFSKAAYWTEAGGEASYRRARARGENVARPAPPIDARPDERRTLVEDFVRLVVEADAAGFIFENVPSITHPRNRPVLNSLAATATAAGFSLAIERVNAVQYGVAQRRERVFVLGARGTTPRIPNATHALSPNGDLFLKAPVTSGEVLAPFVGNEFYEDGEAVSGRWAEHLRVVPPGWNYKAHTEWGGHPNPTFVTETRFWNFLLKLSPELPSWTIAANPGPWTGPFHWEGRRLRTPEMLALQSFPIGYQVTGNRRERVRQIGNAVPPLMAKSMASALFEALAGEESEQLCVTVSA